MGFLLALLLLTACSHPQRTAEPPAADTAALVSQGRWGYANPVLPGFHPDPSVCRVGDDFYLVTSTFQFFPGVPVYHSRDLTHWTQVGHCLTRPSQLELRDAEAGGGIYAPTLRYHDGTYYMIVTNVTAGGNFFVTATDPAGPWSDPVFVHQDGIDPTLFWDDGHCYYVGNSYGGIVLFEIDERTGQKLSDEHMIWYGTGGRYPEGPHLYKKDGWYWLLIAEGGTEFSHKVTMARSRNLWGPYEGCPDNPLLTHLTRFGQSSSIQGLGHADLTQAPDGSWWAVCLGFRWQTGTHHLLGRETFLVPVEWPRGQWPVFNRGDILHTDMQCPTLPPCIPADGAVVVSGPDAAKADITFHADTADFGRGLADPRLNFICNPVEHNYSLTDRPGWLRLTAGDIDMDHSGSPTFIGLRQTAIDETFTLTLDASGLRPDGRAGLTVYMGSRYHYDLAVVNRGGRPCVQVRYRLGRLSHVAVEQPLPAPTATLTVVATADAYTFLADGRELAAMDTHFLSTETAGGFTGIYVGAFCDGAAGSHADIHRFTTH